jgi:hypothetical protein
VLVILIPSVAKERASAKFIFTNFNTDNGVGIHSKPYILAVGLLMSQYSMIGYDTSAHMVYHNDVNLFPHKLLLLAGSYIYSPFNYVHMECNWKIW